MIQFWINLILQRKFGRRSCRGIQFVNSIPRKSRLIQIQWISRAFFDPAILGMIRHHLISNRSVLGLGDAGSVVRVRQNSLNGNVSCVRGWTLPICCTSWVFSHHGRTASTDALKKVATSTVRIAVRIAYNSGFLLSVSKKTQANGMNSLLASNLGAVGRND